MPRASGEMTCRKQSAVSPQVWVKKKQNLCSRQTPAKEATWGLGLMDLASLLKADTERDHARIAFAEFSGSCQTISKKATPSWNVVVCMRALQPPLAD